MVIVLLDRSFIDMNLLQSLYGARSSKSTFLTFINASAFTDSLEASMQVEIRARRSKLSSTRVYDDLNVNWI